MLLGPSARGAGDAPQLVRGPGSPGSCRLLGFTAVYIETRLGKGRAGGSVARCQSRFAWPSRSSLLPAPSNALKSHFQARHRINLWALHIAGSTKQDVGSFFLSLCVLADFFTSRRIWKGREIPPAPPRLSAVQFFSTLITLLWLHPNRFHMLTQLTSVPNYFTCDLVYFLRKSARYLLRTNKINLCMSF